MTAYYQVNKGRLYKVCLSQIESSLTLTTAIKQWVKDNNIQGVTAHIGKSLLFEGDGAPRGWRKTSRGAWLPSKSSKEGRALAKSLASLPDGMSMRMLLCEIAGPRVSLPEVNETGLPGLQAKKREMGWEIRLAIDPRWLKSNDKKGLAEITHAEYVSKFVERPKIKTKC